jgi:predicted RNA-binding Zn-ribbon protein involved in translation (DUF1610 family)
MWPFKRKQTFKCAECGKRSSDTPYLVSDRVVCLACHDALQPQCPSCGADINREKRPKRRSTFRCKSCGEQIHVEPSCWLYPSMFLNDREAGYWFFAERMERVVWAVGGPQPFAETQGMLSQKFGGEPGVGDVLWALMQASEQRVIEEYEAERKSTAKMFGGKIPADMRKSLQDCMSWTELQDFMEEFRDFENEQRESKRERSKKGAKGRRI